MSVFPHTYGLIINQREGGVLPHVNPVFVPVSLDGFGSLVFSDSSERGKRRRRRIEGAVWGFFEKNRWRIISLRSRLRIRFDFLLLLFFER